MSWQKVVNEAVQQMPHRQHNIVFFGDSVCFGQGVSLHKGWVTRIAARMSEISAAHGIELMVVNASISGNTTRQALERMPYDVQSHGVDLLIVQFGMNDCNYWLTDKGLPRASPRAFAANLHEIIERGLNFGARQVLVNTNHPTARDNEYFPGTEMTYQASNAQYNEIIRDVVSEWKEAVILNDVEASFFTHIEKERTSLAAYLLADGLHLSAWGHDLYYELISPVLEKTAMQLISGGLPRFDRQLVHSMVQNSGKKGKKK